MTQAERLIRVRSTLRSAVIGSIVNPSHPDFSFLKEVIDRHPEAVSKYGAGLAGFRVVMNAYGSRAMNIVRVDGSEIDVSFVKACSGKPTRVTTNLRSAMRNAVKPDILAFRKAHADPKTICQICLKPLGSGLFHIDHIVPFEKLADDFISVAPAHPKSFQDSSLDNSAMFRAADHEYEEQWLEYHRNNAELRCVHKRCNLTRKRKTADYAEFDERAG